ATRMLAEKVVEQDLLDDQALWEPDEPVAPPGYELRRCLGQGGCGVVWLAHDTRLDRPVAVKFLQDVRAADLERFRREARFTARLNNPSIVRVYELGEVDERPYIAMQYVDGENFADAKLDTGGVVRVLRDVALALKHAHAEGIIHRDIKPENILLDREGRPYLTDFGIARNISGDIGDTISTEGQVIGTPALMPPEQARGEIQAVDVRSDVYALGAALFVKLSGRYPYDAPNVVDVLHAVIHDPPPMLRSCNAAIPRSLETIALRCMQKAREDRYQTMAEVIADLDRFLSGEPMAAESSAWLRRLVSNVTGLDEPQPVVEDLHADAWWTEGLEIVRELSAWDANLYRVTGSLSRAFARLDAIRRRLDEILAARPDTAWARFYRGVALFRRGRLREAAEDMERAIDRVKNLASAYFELGRLYIALHLEEQRVARKHVSRVGVESGLVSSRTRLDQAVVAFQEAARLSDDVPCWLSDCTHAVRRLSQRDYRGCVEICDRILAEDPDVEGVWKLRGDAQQLAGEEPFESYDRALEIRRSYFEALWAKADAHLAWNQIPEARRALKRALEIYPQYADAAALLARTYLIEARQGATGEILEQGLRIAEDAVGMDNHSYDAALILAEIKIEKGRTRNSYRWLLSALETLTAAMELEGCPNRVNLLAATTRLELARQVRDQGRDPRPDLEAVMALCHHEGARVADNEPWVEIRTAAENELKKLT
ncbi:MAG: protein kinase domain-containing protein, partial [Planctomycetota bacterium]